MQKNSKPNPSPSPTFTSYYNNNRQRHSHNHHHSKQQQKQQQQQQQQLQQLREGDNSDNLASSPLISNSSIPSSLSFFENEDIYKNSNINSPWPSAVVYTPSSSSDLTPLVRHRSHNSFPRSCSRLARLDVDSAMASSSSSSSSPSTVSSSAKSVNLDRASSPSKTVPCANFVSKASPLTSCDVATGSRMLDRTGTPPLPLEFGPSVSKTSPCFHRFSARTKSFFSTELNKEIKRERNQSARNSRIEENLCQIAVNEDNLPVFQENSLLHSSTALQSEDKEESLPVSVGSCDKNNAKEENCARTEQCDDTDTNPDDCPEVHGSEGRDADGLTLDEDEEDDVDELSIENDVVYDADDDADADDELFHDCDDDEWEGNSNLTPSRRTPLHRRKMANSSSPVFNPLQRTRTRSLTDEDLEELRGSIELGFGFDNEENNNLKSTLPALELYYAVNRQYADSKGRGSPISPLERTSSAGSNASTSTDTWRISSPGDHPSRVKTRLRHWAQVVACSIRQSF